MKNLLERTAIDADLQNRRQSDVNGGQRLGQRVSSIVEAFQADDTAPVK